MRFSLLGIPVRVQASFLLMAALLGWWAVRGGPQGEVVPRMVIWMVVVLVSVLAHEMGHALTARRFGADASITLYALGGVTVWGLRRGELGPGKRVLVAAAGSALGIAVGGLALIAYRRGWLVAGSGLEGFAAASFVWVNLVWGVINWLPLRPLDGGHILGGLLEMVAPRHGRRIADGVFLMSAVAAVAAALYFRLTFAAILAGFLAVAELRRAGGGSRRRPASRSAPPPEGGFLFDPPSRD